MDICEFKSSLLYKSYFQKRLQSHRKTLSHTKNKLTNKKEKKQKKEQENGYLTTEAVKDLQSKTILLIMHDNLNIS